MRLRHAIVCLIGTAGILPAQEFIAPAPVREEIRTGEISDTRPTIDGIVKEIFVTKKPWQLINPAAPKKYGTGEKNISKDTGPATPFHSTGVILVGVEW
mgnify:CR=1 FL=1|jgi:hypothetical protein